MLKTERQQFQQLILKVLAMNTPMQTKQVVEKLRVYHGNELVRIGINLHESYYFHDKVLRQLKNLEKQNILLSHLHQGGPFDVSLGWHFRERGKV